MTMFHIKRRRRSWFLGLAQAISGASLPNQSPERGHAISGRETVGRPPWRSVPVQMPVAAGSWKPTITRWYTRVHTSAAPHSTDWITLDLCVGEPGTALLFCEPGATLLRGADRVQRPIGASAKFAPSGPLARRWSLLPPLTRPTPPHPGCIDINSRATIHTLGYHHGRGHRRRRWFCI